MTIITKPYGVTKPDKQPFLCDEKDLGGAELALPKEEEPVVVNPPPAGPRAARRINTLLNTCVVLLTGIIIVTSIMGIMYWYQESINAGHRRGSFIGRCNIPVDVIRDSDAVGSAKKGSSYLDPDLLELLPKPQRSFQEEFEIDLEKGTALFRVEPFRNGRYGEFVHDFVANITGIVDVRGNRCFVMPLDRKRISPPRTLGELLMNVMNGKYNLEMIHEHMWAEFPPVEDRSPFGWRINQLCSGRPIYRLKYVNSKVVKRSIDARSGAEGFNELVGDKLINYQVANLDQLDKAAA